MTRFQSFQDAQTMRGLFQDHLPGFSDGRLRIASCKIDYLLMKQSFKEGFQHKTFLGIGYLLQISDMSAHRQQPLKLYGRAYMGGHSKKVFTKLPPTPLTSPAFGKPLVHLPNLDMIIWAFPNDPKLHHLPKLLDIQTVENTLPLPMERKSALDWSQKNRGIRPNLVRYKPESRCTIRYDLRENPRSTSPAHAIYAKTFANECGTSVFHRNEYFWSQSLANSRGFTVAKPLGLTKEINTVWQDGIYGYPLRRMINRTNFHDLLTIVGKNLAVFHKSRLMMERTVSHKDRVIEARKQSAKIYQVFPEHKKSLCSFLLELEEQVTDFSSAPTSVIHGDFHLEQLMLSKHRIVLCDFDDVAQGDPLQDVADFLAQLYFYDYAVDFIAPMTRSFCLAYARHVDWEMSPDRVRWHMQIQLIRKACRELLQLQPGWNRRMEHYLTLARQGDIATESLHCLPSKRA